MTVRKNNPSIPGYVSADSPGMPPLSRELVTAAEKVLGKIARLKKKLMSEGTSKEDAENQLIGKYVNYSYKGVKYKLVCIWHYDNHDLGYGPPHYHLGVSVFAPKELLRSSKKDRSTATQTSPQYSLSNVELPFDDGFYLALLEMSKRLGIPAKDMLLIMYLESAAFTAQNKYRPGAAVGLTQILPPYLSSVAKFKGSPEEFAKLSAKEQLPYIENYFRYNASKVSNPTQAYILNFMPAMLSNSGVKSGDRNTVLASRHGNRRWGNLTERDIWAANPSLRTNNGKGDEITYGSIEDILSKLSEAPKFKKALQQLNEVSQKYTSSQSSSTVESPRVSSLARRMADEIERAFRNLVV